MRKPPKGKSLAEVNPELASEWHPTFNGKLTANDVSSGLHKKVWWKCDVANDHEWESTVSHRSNGSGCPICSNQKTVLSNCLATLNPKLSKEWHPIKNGILTPFQVPNGGNKKVWWKCDKGDDHEWITNIIERVNGKGCPICSGHKIVLSNCLATLNPKLSKQWHPTKNKKLTPFDVGKNSGRKAWWKCSRGDDHEWITSVNERSKGSDCPICTGHKIVRSNCLATLNPKLSKQWHPTKNGKLTPFDVSENSSKKVWWKCSKGDDHEWNTSINHLTNGSECPVCSNQKIVLSNCLATLNPKLSKEWHPIKNGTLTPFQVPNGGNKIVWWKCNKGADHEWESNISSRVRGNGCSICTGHKTVQSNCLATLNPKLSKQWHPTKNGKLTPFDVSENSSKKVWWKCSKGDDHEWTSTISNRTRGSKCPNCTLTSQSKQELTIAFELMLFFKINPKGFRIKVKDKFWTIDIFIPEYKLGIEFDGNYWHKNKLELDVRKTKELEDDGFKIMRVREEPLKIITDIDVISKIPFNAKEVTNNILTYILEAHSHDAKRINKIEKYILKEEIQNEKELDAYIDLILEERSKKKRERTTIKPKSN